MRCSHWAAPTALALGLGVAISPLGPVATAQAATGTDVFDVHVTDLVTGDPLSSTQVELYNTATGAAVEAVPAHAADPDSPYDSGPGWYQVTNLPNGTYVAKVHDPSGKHHDGYSTSAKLTATSTEDEGEARLAPVGYTDGKLTGTVTQTHSSGFDQQVYIFPSTTTEASVTSGDAYPVDQIEVEHYDYNTTTQSDSWSDTLPAGSYKIAVGEREYQYDPTTGYGEEVYNVTWLGGGGTSADTASVETVSAGATKATGSLALPAGTYTGPGSTTADQISGTVTGATGKLGDVEVFLYAETTYSGNTYWDQVGYDRTNTNGTFAFDNEPAGVYTLEFRDDDQDYSTVWLGNKATADSSGNYLDPMTAGATTFTVTTDDAGSFTESQKLTTKLPVDHSSGAYGAVTTDDGKAKTGEVEVYDVYGNYITGTDTHRDGTWSIPAAQLPPGSYKIETEASYHYNDSDADDFIAAWYGGKTYKKAKTLTVPVKGALDAGASKNQRYGSISGKITLPKAKGTDSAHIWYSLIDADGDQVDGDQSYTSSTSFSFDTGELVPGVYYIKAYGDESNSFDTSYDSEVSEVDFIPQYYKGKYTLASATAIKVGSGGNVTNIDVTLGNKLTALSKPKISGTAKKGKTLTASVGSWNVLQDLGYSYVWKEGSKVVGKASSFKIAKKDAGKSITVTVTASDLDGNYLSGAAMSSKDKIAKVKKAKKKKK